MSLMYNKKIEISFDKDDMLALDGQSKICNWLYNRLLDECIKDYEENNNEKKLLTGRNLRNYGTTLKKEKVFLNTVFSSVLKEPSTRLKHAYDKFFDKKGGYPKYRSWNKKWFSLVYDEPQKGIDIDSENSRIGLALGVIPGMDAAKGKRNPYVYGELKEKLDFKSNEILKTFSLVKQQGKFYGVFAIEQCSNNEIKFKKVLSDYKKAYNEAKKNGEELPVKPILEKKLTKIPKKCKWISLDPNHKNFFVAVDYNGKVTEFEKLKMAKYWDYQIDRIKAKRDICEKKYKSRETINGSRYTVHSPRWNRLNKSLNIAYNKRREQIKTALYSISHALYNEYDLVIIGDYTPTKEVSIHSKMNRSILNQENIGSFRKTLKWVSEKRSKYYIMVDEYNTTKDCCVCGNQEKKHPSVRKFTCKSCKTVMLRDANSAVNIANKASYSLSMSKRKRSLGKLDVSGSIRYGRKCEFVSI